MRIHENMVYNGTHMWSRHRNTTYSERHFSLLSTWTPVYSIQISMPGGGLSPFGGHTAGAQALSRLDPRMLGRLCESYWGMQGLYQFVMMIMDVYWWFLMFIDDYWSVIIIIGMFIDNYGCLLVTIDVCWWLLMYKYYFWDVYWWLWMFIGDYGCLLMIIDV